MENVIVGRIVHLALSPAVGNPACRPFIITDVHQPTVVSGQLIVGPFDEDRLAIGGDYHPGDKTCWITSVVEETPKGHLEPPRAQDHVAGEWHDPRLC